jgi:two-component system response regulator MtrA
MSVLAIADATTVTRPAPARSGSTGRTRDTTRLRPVPDAAQRESAPAPAAVEAAPVTLTIRIEGGERAGRDRVLAALRDLVTAAGPDAAVLVASADTAGAPAAARWTGEAPTAGAGDGAIRLDPRPRTVARDGWPLQLSRLEYDLLLFLARHPRQVFSRSQLLAHVWGHTHTTNRTVDVHVSRLRQKLGDQDLVTTVYGLGYRLADDAPVTIAD